MYFAGSTSLLSLFFLWAVVLNLRPMLNIFDVLLSLAIAFTVTFLAIPVIITVSERKRLFDLPDARKLHDTPVPALGGLGMFAGLVMALLVSLKFQESAEFQYFLAAAFVIFFLGLKDDILVLSPIKKFIGQVMATFLIVYSGGVQIHSLHGFMGMNTLLPESYSLLLTYFTVLVIINSFNLIDGVDGLAGSLGLCAAMFFGFYFISAHNFPYAVLAFSLVGCVGAFLIFNFQPARIFMGDTGSLLIGLVHAILVIKFINVASDASLSSALHAAPAIGFTVLMIPLMDTLRVFTIRIIHRRSPFSPDRNHIHHLLLDLGCSHRMVTFILTGINVVFMSSVYLLRDLGSTWLLLGVIVSFFSIIGALYFMPRPKLFVAKQAPIDQKNEDVLPLTDDTFLTHKK